MKLLHRTSTLLVIGIPLIVASLYYHYETTKIDASDDTELSSINKSSSISKEIKELTSFSFDNDVVSANIVANLGFTKTFTITNIDEKTKQIAIIFSNIDSNGETKGGSAGSAMLYTQEDFTGKITVNTSENMWNIENQIQGSALDYSLKYDIETYSNMLISTISKPIEMELNQAVPIAVYIPSNSDDASNLISIDNMSTKEIIESINTDFSLIQIITLDDKNANPLDYK